MLDVLAALAATVGPIGAIVAASYFGTKQHQPKTTNRP